MMVSTVGRLLMLSIADSRDKDKSKIVAELHRDCTTLAECAYRRVCLSARGCGRGGCISHAVAIGGFAGGRVSRRRKVRVGNMPRPR